MCVMCVLNMESGGSHISDFVNIDDQTVRFKLNRCPSKIANGLRRVLMSETPMMALELINVYENSSVLHSDFIAHRLGLLPLDSNNVENFLFKKDCDCEHCCDKCSVHFKCDVTNTTSGNIEVTTADLIPMNEEIGVRCLFSERGENAQNLPILKLAPTQRIHFTAIAHKGIGEEHCKWSPVCVCKCVYSVDENADKLVQFEQENDPTEFDFTLETTEGIDPKKALKIGFDVLIDKLIVFERTLRTLEL